METRLKEQQSLSLISEMIAQTRNNFQRGAGNAFILNGCAVAVIALLNAVLLFTLPNPGHSFHVWWLMVPVWFIDRYIDKRTDSAATVKTHFDRIISMTWRAFAAAVVLLLVTIFGFAIGGDNSMMYILITPGILIMAGTAQLITGVACRFRPVMTGAYILWGGALACLASFLLWPGWAGATQFLILAACMAAGFALPGYRLNKMAGKNV